MKEEGKISIFYILKDATLLLIHFTLDLDGFHELSNSSFKIFNLLYVTLLNIQLISYNYFIDYNYVIDVLPSCCLNVLTYLCRLKV